MALDRDLSIFAQNAGTTAAAIVGPYKGGSLTEYLNRYDKVRQHVFDGTTDLGEGHRIDGEIVPDLDEATSRIENAFEGAEEVKGDDAAFKIIAHGSTGQPAPDWLAREFAYQVKQGKIADGDNELFDNRGKLPQFGGDGNPNAPWFRTSKGKVGLWPPKAKGGK